MCCIHRAAVSYILIVLHRMLRKILARLNDLQSCFDIKRKRILGRDERFFVVVLSKMDLGNVDTWKM